jgi:hypothetical protein
VKTTIFFSLVLALVSVVIISVYDNISVSKGVVCFILLSGIYFGVVRLAYIAYIILSGKSDILEYIETGGLIFKYKK